MGVTFVDAVDVPFGGYFDVLFGQQEFADRRVQHESIDAAPFAQRQDHHCRAAVKRVSRGHHVLSLLERVVDVRLIAVVGFFEYPENRSDGYETIDVGRSI